MGTPGAIYCCFESLEAIYGALLAQSESLLVRAALARKDMHYAAGHC